MTRTHVSCVRTRMTVLRVAWTPRTDGDDYQGRFRGRTDSRQRGAPGEARAESPSGFEQAYCGVGCADDGATGGIIASRTIEDAALAFSRD